MDYMDASRQPALQDAIYGLCITGTAYYKMQGAGSPLQYAMYSRCITGSMDYEMHVTGSGRLGLSSCGGVEYWVVGGGGGGWGDFDQ